MSIKAVKDYLKNEENSVRGRMFIFNIMATLIILLFSLIETIVMDDNIVKIIAIAIVMVILFFVANIAVIRERVNISAGIICGVMCFGFFPAVFFTSGGIVGEAPLWFIYNMLLICLVLDDKAERIFFTLEEIEGVLCYIYAYNHPELFSEKASLKTYINSFVTLILISVAIGIMIRIQKRLFVKERIRAEEQKKEIEALSASQNRFFSSMSHEIRTPINTIIGLNEMILREDISDEVADDAVNIRVAGKLLLNLINDILDMSKFQAGDMHLLVEPYNPGNMLSDIVGMLWIRAKEKGLEFNVNVAPDIPAELMGDEVRIKQILMNILNNAIKYTKEGSISLAVECEKQEDNEYNIIYTVSDTGMGIKKEDIPYLFTAFKRVDEDNTKHIEGTGLGLSIVKQFLELMDGKVTVNSVYTKGSTFIIEIPQKAITDKVIGERDYEKKVGVGKRTDYKQKFEAPEAKILVVDDNAANILVVTKLLRDTKVQIDTAQSGIEALKLTQNTHYDLIFMDHLMPEMDGIECFRKIREQTGGMSRDTYVVILTANAGEENRELYAREGFDGYLIKPITGEDLENEVYRLLPKELVNIVGTVGGEITDDTISWMKATQKKKRVSITTDSVADLPSYLLKKYDIAVIPHNVHTAEGTFKDGIEIDTDGILAYMQDKTKTVEPLAPSVSEYEKFFADELTKANNVIHISVSGLIEHTGYPAAVEGGNSFENVTVVDSAHLSSGQGLLALVAARFAKAGMNTNEILERLQIAKDKVHTSFIVSNLDYLARAGQVTERRANLVRSFLARPVIVMKNGKMSVGRIYFGGKEKVWKKYVDSALSTNNINKAVLFVTYVGLDKRELEFIKNCIEKRMKFDSIIFMQANPAIATNCGPGTFGLLMIEE